MNTGPKIFLAAILCIVTAVAFDCSCGNTKHYECRVVGHHYVPPYTETVSSTDDDGNVSFSTVHHPEEFHILTLELAGDATFDCETTRARYYLITNDQIVTVAVRHGRWTKLNYLPHIVP